MTTLPIEERDDCYLVEGPIQPIWGPTHLNACSARYETAAMLQIIAARTRLNEAGTLLTVQFPKPILVRGEVFSIFLLRQNVPGLYLSLDAEGSIAAGQSLAAHVAHIPVQDARTRVDISQHEGWLNVDIPMAPVKSGRGVNVLFHPVDDRFTLAMGALLTPNEDPEADGSYGTHNEAICAINSSAPGVLPLDVIRPHVHTAEIIRPAFGKSSGPGR